MKKGRHKKVRYIQKMPKIAKFSPRGKSGRPDEIELKIDQFETIKLADHQGYNQSEGAEAMGISRSTFGRILRAAHVIIADALVSGKTIRIRVSDIQVGIRRENLPKKNKNDLKLKTNGSIKNEEAIRQTIWEYNKKSKNL